MRFPFGFGRRRREIDEVRARIAQLRDEIAKLEQAFEDSAGDQLATDAYRSVQQLRSAMALEELIAKRTELADLEDREAVLEAATAQRTRAPIPPPAPPPPSEEPEPVAAEARGDEGPPSERAIIEPARAAAIEPTPAAATPVTEVGIPAVDEPGTISIDDAAALGEAWPEAEEAPAAPVEAEPVAVGEEEAVEAPLPDGTEPEPEPSPVPEPEPEPAPLPTAEEAALPAEAGGPSAAEGQAVEEPVALPVGDGEAAAALAVAGRPRGLARAVLVAVAVVALGGVGFIGAYLAGLLPLDGGGSAPTPTAPVVAIQPTVPPTVTLTRVAPTVPPVQPTPPPTVALPVVPPPTLAPEVIPETEPEPRTATENVGILAPPGFSGAFLRSVPAMNAPVLRFLPNGTRVDVFEESAVGSGFQWARARTLDGLEGWVVSSTVGR